MLKGKSVKFRQLTLQQSMLHGNVSSSKVSKLQSEAQDHGDSELTLPPETPKQHVSENKLGVFRSQQL